jgi:hypothetical protein
VRGRLGRSFILQSTAWREAGQTEPTTYAIPSCTGAIRSGRSTSTPAVCCAQIAVIPQRCGERVDSTTASDYYNVYDENGQFYQLTPEQKDGGSLGDAITGLSVPVVPEPDTWTLLILGFAGLGFGRYRRSCKAVSISA